MTTMTAPQTRVNPYGSKKTAFKITIFHCFNSLNTVSFLDEDNYEVNAVKMPCSSASREVFLLKAFENGADAVAVMVCPIGSCRYNDGNIRAAKRVARIKKILDEIGIDGRRLNLYNVPHGDEIFVKQIVDQIMSELAVLGPNPAA